MRDTRDVPPPITAADEVHAVAQTISAAGAFAMDLEFVPEERYIPELALVQVAWGDTDAPEVAAIDPLATDPRPVLELVGRAEVETVLHAAQADLALLSTAFDIGPANVLDTQIAAGFLGMGDQVGYAPLLERALGVRLEKGSQFTDWLRRPLSDRQIEYALDDVRYLPRLWADLRADLESRGRMGWVREESTRLALTADRRPAPEDAYQKVKGWGRLRGRALGALRGLAAWREQEARQRNRPTSRVLSDRSAIELARSVPQSDEELLAVRGVEQGLVRRHGPALLQALREGAADPPSLPRGRAPDQRIEVWGTLMQGLVRARALEAQIAGRFIATRGDLDALSAWWLDHVEESDRGTEEAPPEVALLSGWRRELVGEEILGWLAGEATLTADPSNPAGLRLEPRA